MSGAGEDRGRGLLVLADGAQAAFAAGAVAELARRGAVWVRGAGAGLGAQVGLLAILGEGVEAERRWMRDAQLGCPLLRSRLAAFRETLGPSPGALLSADAWTLPGWLDPGALAEHLSPEAAAVPARLDGMGRSFGVAVEDLVPGRTGWVELAPLSAAQAGDLLLGTATFPAGWGPREVDGPSGRRRLWGGVGAAIACPPPWAGDGRAWDLVCGFPVPACARPSQGGSLLEAIQRRDEARAAAVVGEWLGGASRGRVRVVAPTPGGYRSWAGRDNAELGVEYPLPWDRNAEVAAGIVRFGAFVAGAPEAPPA